MGDITVVAISNDEVKLLVDILRQIRKLSTTASGLAGSDSYGASIASDKAENLCFSALALLEGKC